MSKTIGLTLAFLLLGILSYQCDSDNQFAQGGNLYQAHCAACHMEKGEGLRGLIPPIAQSDYIPKNADKLACIIRYGLQDTIVVNGKSYDQPMLGIKRLNDIEIANIINYINKEWGYSETFISPKDVAKQLENCEEKN